MLAQVPHSQSSCLGLGKRTTGHLVLLWQAKTHPLGLQIGRMCDMLNSKKRQIFTAVTLLAIHKTIKEALSFSWRKITQ